MTVETLRSALLITLLLGGLAAGIASSLLFYIKNTDMSSEYLPVYFIFGVFSMVPFIIYSAACLGL